MKQRGGRIGLALILGIRFQRVNARLTRRMKAFLSNPYCIALLCLFFFAGLVECAAHSLHHRHQHSLRREKVDVVPRNEFKIVLQRDGSV